MPSKMWDDYPPAKEFERDGSREKYIIRKCNEILSDSLQARKWEKARAVLAELAAKGKE